MTLQVANNAFGELNADINTSVTTIVLKSGNGARFPSLAGSQYFYATLIDTSNNLEIVKCTARSSDTLTVVRAQDGTSARSFVANDRIELRPVAAFFDTYQQKEASVDMNGTELILDADGDTSITADTDDQIDIKIGGSDKISLTSSGSTINNSSTINNKLTVSAADGVVDNDWVMDVRNDEQTDNRSWGLRVSAGSTVTDRALDILDHAQANTLFRVNGDGTIIKPKQPCFSAYISSGGHAFEVTDTTPTTIVFNGENFDTTNSHSNGIFTAPVAGKYFFNSTISFYGTDTLRMHDFAWAWYKNNSAYITQEIGNYIQESGASEFNTMTITTIIDLAVNDTIRTKMYSFGSPYLAGKVNVPTGTRSGWSGFLIG